jgi:hypothetical protein
VNEKLNKELFGINTQIKYLNKTSSSHVSMNEEQASLSQGIGLTGSGQLTDADQTIITASLLKDALNRNLMYLLYINESNEQFNSVNLIVLNKWRLGQAKRKFNAKQRINHKIKGLLSIHSPRAFTVYREMSIQSLIRKKKDLFYYFWETPLI